MGIVRIFLAMVVATDHWWLSELYPLKIAHLDNLKLGFDSGHAVVFFYVISGFLITYTLSRNYPANTEGLKAFYWNRFVRIFSVYWPLLALTVVTVASTHRQFAAGNAVDIFTMLFLFGQDWSVSFADFPNRWWGGVPDGMHQAWTLGAELTFYALAPVFLRYWKIAVALLLCSLGLRLSFVSAWGVLLHEPWTYQFFPTALCFFLLGHFACRLSDRIAHPIIGTVFVAASFATMYCGSYYGFDNARFWAAILLFAVGLPGFFRATKNLKWSNRIGDLSYPFYLIHTLPIVWFGTTLQSFLAPPATTPIAGTVAFLSLVLVGAAVCHYAIELPVTWGMHKILFAVRPKLRSEAT